jgi:hypothetical protein
MIDPASLGFDPFLRRRTTIGGGGILDSQIGAGRSYNPSMTDDMFPGGVVNFQQATIGGFSIGNDTLQSLDGSFVIDAKNRKITMGVASDGQIIMDAVTKKITLGSANIVLDGANKRILINDGTNDRVLIGYQSGGF